VKKTGVRIPNISCPRLSAKLYTCLLSLLRAAFCLDLARRRSNRASTMP
jgi:hypothetical protein